MKTLFLITWLLSIGFLAVLSLLPNVLTTPGYSDKLLHITAYCVLVLYPAIMTRKAIHLAAIIALLFAFGICMEIFQHYTGGRVSSVYDAAANGVGLIAGLAIGLLMRSGLNAAPK